MLFHAHAPASLWFDAFITTIYIINRLPSLVLDNKSPFELLFGSIPHYPNFKPFGCHMFPYLHDYSPHEIAPRSSPCIFLGYSSAYKVFSVTILPHALILHPMLNLTSLISSLRHRERLLLATNWTSILFLRIVVTMLSHLLLHHFIDVPFLNPYF